MRPAAPTTTSAFTDELPSFKIDSRRLVPREGLRGSVEAGRNRQNAGASL